MNNNSYSITTYSIPCNTDSYYSVITITVYQTYPKCLYFNSPQKKKRKRKKEEDMNKHEIKAQILFKRRPMKSVTLKIIIIIIIIK